MIHSIRQKTVVESGGRVEVLSPELPEGAVVEVIILIEPEQDATEYLLSAEANRNHLLQAIENVEKRENLVVITPQERY